MRSRLRDAVADALLLDVHVVGVEMNGDVRLADAVDQRDRLLRRVEQMRLIAVAGLDADQHVIFGGAPRDRPQHAHDIGKLLLGPGSPERQPSVE